MSTRNVRWSVLTLSTFLIMAPPEPAAAASPPQGTENVASTPTSEVSPLDRMARLTVERVLLDDALLALESRSGISLVYSPSRLPELEVTCYCHDLRVGEALSRLLAHSRWRYSVYGNHVVIEPPAPTEAPLQRYAAVSLLTVRMDEADMALARARLQGVSSLMHAQRQGTISGQVIDAITRQPLSATQVFVEGQDLSVLTQANGNFQFTNVPAGTHTVTANRLGYRATSHEVTVVSGETVSVNFELATEAVALDALIVVGYGAQARETVSGSISMISADEIMRTSSATTADALVGKIQGINTRLIDTGGVGRDESTGNVTDGRPGAPAALQIRNMGNPLFVIDGVPTENSWEFNQLNPADIESISVLKDASASVYGFRAANGVVLVETRRGAVDQAPQIRMDGHYGWQNFARYHYEHTANAYEFVFAEVDSQNNLRQSYSRTPEELELWRTGAPGYESTNHYPLAVNNPNAMQFQINASVSGGSDAVRYYLSLGHVNQDYVMKENNFNRTNLQANLSTNLTDRLSIGTELRARYEIHDNIAVPGHQDPVRTLLVSVHSSWPTENPWVDPEERTMIDGNVRYLTRSIASWTKEHSGWQEDARRRLASNFWAEYRLPFGTTVRGTYSYAYGLRAWDKHQYSWNAWYCDDNATMANCVQGTGNPARERVQTKREDVEDFAQIQVMHDLSYGAHSLSGVAAFELAGTELFETGIIATPPNNLSHLFSTVDITNVSNNWGITRRASYVGRLNYDYDLKYLVEVLGRYDGSYLYHPDNRWGFFPGVSLGWRLTQEDFLEDRYGFLDELKLRASWGQAGREQGVSPWGFLGGGTYGVGNGTVGEQGLIPGLRPRGLPVTELSWVTSTSRNVGVDLEMFDRRLVAELDVFERKLTGLPAGRADVLLPAEVGYSLPNENLESEANRGFEAIVRWNDQIGSVFYSVAPNVTVARRKILDRYRPRYGNSWDRYRNADEDRWAGVNWGYNVIGQFQTVAEIENHTVSIDGQGNRTLLPGDFIYEDVNGDGIIDALDLRPIGHQTTGTPIVNYGMSTSLGYRGVTMSVDFAGGAMYAHNRGAETKNIFHQLHNAQSYFMDRWHREDPFDPQSEWVPGRYPALRLGQVTSSFSRTDTFWRTNVRYLRVRRMEIGYHVPNNLARNIGMSGMRVYSSVTNPFTFDNVSHYGFDPEVAQGIGLQYPTTRVVNIGFSANLGGIN